LSLVEGSNSFTVLKCDGGGVLFLHFLDRAVVVTFIVDWKAIQKP
jgi:hypothetical protein